MKRQDSELLASAEYAADGGMTSPHCTSSNMDRAHRMGLWARSKGIVPLEIHTSRGHKMVLNRDYYFDFGRNEADPIITRAR